MRRWIIALVVLALLAGCSGAPAASVSKADCATADADGVIVISAKSFRFSARCMIAPVGVAFTIRFTNNDGIPHDMATYDSPSKGTRLFTGDLISGPGRSIDYAVDPMAAGEYYFDCTIHPGDMHGTLFVETTAARSGS